MQYVLVTPARDEAKKIGRTIESVLAQTRPPKRWIIVSDGSTDGTDEIVRSHLDANPFLTLVRASADGRPNFGSKVNAFNRGYRELEALDYDLIGNLDADVSFAPDYFERLLGAFERDAKLGLAGGQIFESWDGKLKKQDVSRNSVAGAVQLFRREVFESIGGYHPLKGGGIDAVAEIQVRMAGWEARTLGELEVHHMGRVVTGRRGLLGHRFQKGANNYLLGYHPLFQLFVCAYRLFERPWLIGGSLMGAGYLWTALRRRERVVPPDVVAFLRREQLARLRGMLRGGGLGRA